MWKSTELLTRAKMDRTWASRWSMGTCRLMLGKCLVPAHALCRELVEIALPALVLLVTERVQIVPCENAGVVEIVEGDAHRVVADRIDFGDRHVALAGHRHPLLRR